MGLPKGATEFVVPAAIILPVGTNGKPGTKTHSLVLEVRRTKCLVSEASVDSKRDCERLVGYLQGVPVVTCGSVPGSRLMGNDRGCSRLTVRPD